MATKIRVLSPEVVRKVAAGEVIERPASVVKELLENSLDAGSGRIRVEVEDGGRQKIGVLDDGEGMTQEDALLALERHSTSKISQEKDLDGIRTLGFRGEALPSIAAVSRLRLVTRTAEELAGTCIVGEGGQIVDVRSTGSPPGTWVEVKDLFYNLPARRKFLRGARTELAHIIEVVTRMALMYCSTGFKLLHNKRSVLDLSPSQHEEVRLRDALGKEVASKLRRIDMSWEEGGIHGWATDPTYARGSSKGIYTYVNGRYVRDKLLSHAISEAYRSFIPAGTYPVAVLAVSIPFSQVDVNVHPMKMEVRFQKAPEVHRLVAEGLRSALGHPRSGIVKPRGLIRVQEDVGLYAVSSVEPRGDQKTTIPWRTVGQLKGSYVVVEGDDGVMILDQHAAHERLLYYQLMKSLEEKTLPQQRLLLPQTVDLRREEVQTLVAHQGELAALGLELEEFGKSTVAVKAIPTFLEPEDLQSLLESLSAELLEHESGGSMSAVFEKLCAQLACQGAVRANRRLRDEEIDYLLKEWAATGQPATCPHGRPFFVKWSWREVERWFGRT